MKHKLVSAFLGILLVFSATARGQGSPASDPALDSELKDWISKVQDQASSGKRDEKDYADLLRKADEIFARHKDGQVLMLKMQVYVEILTNTDRFDKAIACVQQVKKEFPDSPEAQSVDQLIAQLTQTAAQDKVYSSLAPGIAMPDFAEQDANGKPLSLAAHHGKVVLLDFWATWCPPCMAEFPNVKKVYGDFHDKGLDIVGVDLDNDRGKFDSFVKDRGVTWPQFYDGQGWTNKLVVKYGVSGIPATFLLDTNGVILAKGLKGKELADAVATALAGK